MSLPVHFITVRFEVLMDVTPEDIHEDLCQVYHEGQEGCDKIMNGLVDVDVIKEPESRHVEDKLGGVVEAGLNRVMIDQAWLMSMASDPNITLKTDTEVFQALESYICDHLARITKDPEPLSIVAYLQDADGNERTLGVTAPCPEDGTFCVHMDDQGQSWIRIVPSTVGQS